MIANTDMSAPSDSSTDSSTTSNANHAGNPVPVPLRWPTPVRPADDRLAGAVSAGASALTRADPWNDPQVQALIDQWLRSAIPPLANGRSGSYSYSEWGQIKGPGITIAGAPDHPSGWSRHQSMWAVRMKFDSLNLCTLGDFIERQIAGKAMDGCNKAEDKSSTALPDWLPSATQATALPSSNRAEEALTLARTEINRREAEKVSTQSDTSARPSHIATTPAPVQRVNSLLDKMEAIPNADWIGNKPSIGHDGRTIFALVAELQDKRTDACANEAKRKNWNVVGFSSRLSLQHAQYQTPPSFPMILGVPARDLIYAIHLAANRKDIPIPPATAYLIDPSGRIVQSGLCQTLVGIDFGVSEGKK